MNRFILLAIAIFTFGFSNGGIKIKGELENAANTEYIYLYEYVVNHLKMKDSADVKNSSFQFKYKELIKGKYRIGLSKVTSVDIILGDENLQLNADVSNYTETFKIKESVENNEYQTFLNLNDAFQKKSSEINLRARKISNADPKRNEKVASLQNELNDSKLTLHTGLKKIVSERPNSFASQNANFILQLDKVSQEDFFNQYDNKSLVKGDVFVLAYNSYLSRFLANISQKELKDNLLELPNLREKESQDREFIYLSLIEWLKGLEPNFAAKVAARYYVDYPNSEFKNEIKNSLPTKPPTIGDYAPEISLMNPGGKEMKLSSTKGKVVLLDFWASWCGPCRRENPNVVNTYKEYKDKGFTVFSVSLDKQANRWKSAIEKDNLIWDTHVSDLRGWGSLAGKAYGVSSIPATFLIDENGIIIAKNLRGHQLEKKLKEVLGE